MIRAKVYKNRNNDVYAFKIKEHGDPIVCAAVSLLSLNTINSVDKFTQQVFTHSIDNGGFLTFECKSDTVDKEAALLLNSLLLGLVGIEESYPMDIKLTVKHNKTQ
ncbi:MAG: ribosomal-processing cysteine protease Prp [Defluviitaleaceae bacterium]|nr:ribosomal-processing cysteine protease Prp [Defluviitaleaceae bacterium]